MKQGYYVSTNVVDSYTITYDYIENISKEYYFSFREFLIEVG